jgi:hypothetical protein
LRPAVNQSNPSQHQQKPKHLLLKRMADHLPPRKQQLHILNTEMMTKQPSWTMTKTLGMIYLLQMSKRGVNKRMMVIWKATVMWS